MTLFAGRNVIFGIECSLSKKYVMVERRAISASLEYNLDGATERHKTQAYSQDMIYRTPSLQT